MKSKAEIKEVFKSNNGVLSLVLRGDRLFLEFGYFHSLAFVQIDISEVWAEVCEFMRSPKSEALNLAKEETQ